jgi:hypothetical protein
MKNILYVLIGAGAMFAVLKFMSGKKTSVSVSGTVHNGEQESNTGDLVIAVLGTPEARTLILSPQFKAVVKTNEFKQLYSVLGTQYLTALARSLV